MRMILAVAALALLGTAARDVDRHIELVESWPAADTVLSAGPAELILTFSADLDYGRSAVGLRGPAGVVNVTDPRESENPRVLSVGIEDAVPEGRYTVSWTAAPHDDHAGRGRFTFEVKR